MNCERNQPQYSLTSSLEFIRDEGINILVQIDVKDLDAMAYAYDVITQHANAAGVPATGEDIAYRSLTPRVVSLKAEGRSVPDTRGVGAPGMGP